MRGTGILATWPSPLANSYVMKFTEARDSLAPLQQPDSENAGSDQLDSLRETQSQLEDVILSDRTVDTVANGRPRR
jgi:hypothetical protein